MEPEPVRPVAPHDPGRTVFSQGWREVAFPHWAVDADGRRGIVFRSLDASRLLPVLVARWLARLPYQWSAIQDAEHLVRPPAAEDALTRPIPTQHPDAFERPEEVDGALRRHPELPRHEAGREHRLTMKPSGLLEVGAQLATNVQGRRVRMRVTISSRIDVRP